MTKVCVRLFILIVAMLCFSCLSSVILIITCCLLDSVIFILMILVKLMLPACWRLLPVFMSVHVFLTCAEMDMYLLLSASSPL